MGDDHAIPDDLLATIHTSKGAIRLKLFPNEAPLTVANCRNSGKAARRCMTVRCAFGLTVIQSMPSGGRHVPFVSTATSNPAA